MDSQKFLKRFWKGKKCYKVKLNLVRGSLSDRVHCNLSNHPSVQWTVTRFYLAFMKVIAVANNGFNFGKLQCDHCGAEDHVKLGQHWWKHYAGLTRNTIDQRLLGMQFTPCVNDEK